MRVHLNTLPPLVAIAIVNIAIALPTAAQEDGAPVSIGTYRVIDSQVLGETRRLLIHLPRGYEGSAITYPVVYHSSPWLASRTSADGSLE